METKLYELSLLFAREYKIPKVFAAIVLKETPKALYLYGHGTTETTKMGICCICGCTLTHPVSVLLGIGPECGSHYHDWDAVGGYTMENLERLKVVLENIKIDRWMPKGVIKGTYKTETIIEAPKDHPMLVQKDEPKKVTLIEGKGTLKQYLQIEFPFSHVDLANVKTLTNRNFDPYSKRWFADFTLSNLNNLIKWGFQPCPALQGILQEEIEKQKGMEKAVERSKTITTEIAGLRHKLFPFQRDGVKFIESRNGRALVADEMGLGKTVQALAWLQMHPEARPAVIMVPASLKLNWAKEAQAWMLKPNYQILSGTSPDLPLTGDVIIINYDILPAWVDKLEKARPKVVIMDEIHYIKNRTAKRSKATQRLCKAIPYVIGLSGTPIVNRPVEAYNAISIISPNFEKSFFNYARRYCAAKNNGYGWDFSGASNTEELHKRLTESFMIRRKKGDVLQDLPDKVKGFIPVELDNRALYDRAEQDFISFVAEYKGQAAAQRAMNAQALAEIEGLKQLAVQGKMKEVVNWIKDFLETGEKLVVMAVHKMTIDTLMQEFKDVAVKVDGSTPQSQRQEAVELFQQSEDVRLFVGNIKAAGVGLTLTASSNVAFVELPWTPGDLQQAEDRCHRIGQKSTVNIHYLLASDTIEEKIASLLDDKAKILSSVLDGQEVSQESTLQAIMNSY